jgi:hypothetical protein
MNRKFFDEFCSENAVVIPRPRFIQEHKKLLQILRDKKPQELEKERKDQAKELKEIIGSGTRRTKFLKAHKLEDRSYSLKELSNISDVPISILQEVYDRGIGAYKTNPESVRLKGSYVKNVKAPMSKKLSKEQWAMARVYSFLTGNPKHDNDLRK